MMELQEMLEITPAEYLKAGFLQQDGSLREGINGVYSLAIAYQCREEEVELPRLEKAIEDLQQQTGSDLKKVREIVVSVGSKSIQKVFEASERWLTQPPQYGAFVSHLKRIMAQLALLRLTPADTVEENVD